MRQLRAAHEDAHYCAAAFKYFREHAVSLREDGVKVSVIIIDDKCKVPLGEPGCYTCTVQRGKASIVMEGQQLVWNLSTILFF